MATKKNVKKGTISDVIDDITDRFDITRREARDIVTAVGTVIKSTSKFSGTPVSKAVKNLGKQVKETGKAAATGKKGTASAQIGLSTFNNPSLKNKSSGSFDYPYKKGKKRK